jgi:glutamine synthetase
VELRCADPSCNPYLALAVMLEAGLEGVTQELAPPPPVEESVVAREEPGRLTRQGDALPATLGDALDALRADEVVREALGDLIADWFIEAKTQEWLEYRAMVHPWERERYLATF